ncbi:MAG: FtsX-like permease family protein [Candidatus Bathyarchaeota archaeon]|nr:FtsX-like permease family protein [Candidatus Bathyarchaeota archaeon]
MSLLRFRYLNRNRILSLFLIITLTSTLFSVTAFSFLGFYNGFSNYVGEDSDVVAIYGTAASTPLTGLVPLFLADEIVSVNGVLAASPEVIAPCVIAGQSVFVRGVMPQSLSKLNTIAITEGAPLLINDTESAVIGRSLSNRLNLKLGDKITVFSIISEKYANLEVAGIFDSDSPLDDEVLVPVYVGQWLRGVNYNLVSVIRAKIDPTQVNINTLYDVIADEASPSATSTPSQSKGDAEQQLEGLLSISKTRFNLGSVTVDQAQDFMKSYLNRYGVSKDTLIILSIVVLVFASGTAAGALTLFLNQHKHEIGVLRSVGASTKKIKKDLLVKLLPWSLVASTFGVLLSAAVLLLFQNFGYLQVLSHRLVFQLDPIIVAANYILISTLVVAGVARLEMKQ